MQIKIEGKGIEFESPYSNTEVAIEFRRLIENGEMADDGFAQSLYQGAKKFGKYSPRQIPWLHVKVANHENRPTRPTQESALTGLQLLHAHLANCRESRENGGKGLKHPMVGLLVGDTNVVLKLAGSRSKNSGKVSVASDHRFGQGTFYGWIDSDGNMNRSVPTEVADILRRVGQDPARVISEIGKESGRCCYCFAELSTVQSKIAGCGRTCATNYGVEYPGAAVTRTFVLDNLEILEGSSDREKWELSTV